ncbi:MAG: glycosyltransferase family 2 protein [Candidatus Omnitrophica bacterium]|nr:glycosyltransferase family 2 protein [Candidatus Omnitrophota bacterium]
MTEVNEKQKIMVLICAHNEEKKIGKTVTSIPKGAVDEIVVVDDGSTDMTARIARQLGVTVLPIPQRKGVGHALRYGIAYAQKQACSILVIMAGNSKDDGSQIPRLTQPISRGEAVFVQGSRYLPGGAFDRLPLYRFVATRFIHPLLYFLFTGKKMTDTTNGFRAIAMSFFDDPRIIMQQDWLTQYELEPYLLFKALTLGYALQEVPVSKIYPPKELGYSKMPPVVGWWSILRPVLFLGLRIRK